MHARAEPYAHTDNLRSYGPELEKAGQAGFFFDAFGHEGSGS